MEPKDGLTKTQELVADKVTNHHREEINPAISSTEHQKQEELLKPMLLPEPVTNNFWTTSGRDLPKEEPEELLPSEESSRLLMITDPNLLTLLSSKSACTTSELE